MPSSKLKATLPESWSRLIGTSDSGDGTEVRSAGAGGELGVALDLAGAGVDVGPVDGAAERGSDGIGPAHPAIIPQTSQMIMSRRYPQAHVGATTLA